MKMNNRSISLSLKRQRGAATLIVALLLLFGMTLVAFFGNRIFIFEQKTSANQFRSTKAFEAAEAGLEWALGQLNDPRLIDAAPSCAAATTGFTTKNSFRVRYVVPTSGSSAGFYPPADSRAGCSITATGTLNCNCPVPGTAPSFVSATDARFRVQFNAISGDRFTFEVVSTGCTSEDTACDGTTVAADATAVVRTILKVVPSFGNAPSAALTTGSATIVSGNLSVINTDQASNGITINAGTSVTQGSATNVVSLPGTPPSASILDSDGSLTALSTADSTGDLFFQSYFGKTMEAFRNDSQTKVISSSDCSGATACGALVSSWYDQGFKQFWVYPDIQFTNANLPAIGTLGSAARPIYLVGDGDLEMKSNLVAYGMLYAATATATENWDYAGTGTATIFGAIVSRGSFTKGTGTMNVVYDPKVFGLASAAPSGVLVRVPGSWRDKSSTY